VELGDFQPPSFFLGEIQATLIFQDENLGEIHVKSARIEKHPGKTGVKIRATRSLAKYPGENPGE